MIEQLKEQIKVLAKARRQAGTALECRNMARVEWENQNKVILDAVTDTATIVSETEATLRELTLQAYAETGNKAPAPGVGIREVTKLEYDAKIAFDWAKEHAIALKLDVSGFEKVAKVSPPDFVTIFQQPQATIATNLDTVCENNTAREER